MEHGRPGGCRSPGSRGLPGGCPRGCPALGTGWPRRPRERFNSVRQEVLQEATPDGGNWVLRKLCQRKENLLQEEESVGRSVAPQHGLPSVRFLTACTPSRCPCEGRATPPSEVSRVPRDPGWEGELRVGGCKGEGVSRPLVLSSYRSFCLVEPETLASSTLLSGSRRDRTPGSKQKVALIDAGTGSADPMQRDVPQSCRQPMTDRQRGRNEPLLL